jgi:hypothetical protein
MSKLHLILGSGKSRKSGEGRCRFSSTCSSISTMASRRVIRNDDVPVFSNIL